MSPFDLLKNTFSDWSNGAHLVDMYMCVLLIAGDPFCQNTILETFISKNSLSNGGRTALYSLFYFYELGFYLTFVIWKKNWAYEIAHMKTKLYNRKFNQWNYQTKGIQLNQTQIPNICIDLRQNNKTIKKIIDEKPQGDIGFLLS